MPIYVDVSAAVHGKAGLGRYAQQLAKALAGLDVGRLALFYNRSRGSELPLELQRLPASNVRAGYKPWRIAVLLGHLARISFDRLLPGAELYHATEHLLMPLRYTPSVLTVHDLIYRLFPRHHKRLNYWFLNAAMPIFVRRADAIIAISEATKRDLVTHYQVEANKIQVIYEAAAPAFRPVPQSEISRVRDKYHLPERYLLHVGTIEPRKNLSRLLQALERIRVQGIQVGLVIVGSKGWLYGDFFRRLEASPARDVVVMPGFVPDADLPAVYAAASACVLASVYEGFGLPILEAMACGTPVACSRVSSLPELGGDAARYFNPYDLEEMTHVLAEVLRDGELRAAMRERGLQQAAQFSWERAAKETMALYERVLKATTANKREEKR